MKTQITTIIIIMEIILLKVKGIINIDPVRHTTLLTS